MIEDKEADHFLGQVVTNMQDGQEYIVDGQQRVTTATIFLAVLRDEFRKLNSPKAEVRADDIQQDLIKGKGNYVLTQSIQSAKYFRDLIQVPNQFDLVKDKAHTDSEQNFVKAYKFLSSKVTGKVKELKIDAQRLDYLEQLRTMFLKHMFIMKISTEDEASAFIIFETLNARGRDLESSDLLKNHLFRMADGDDTVQHSWDGMMEPLDYKSSKATRLIRAYWNGTHEFATEKKLYRALNRSITNRSQAISFLRSLDNLADYFAPIDDVKNESLFSNPQLVENFKILNLLSAKTYYPLILVMIDKGDVFSEADLVKVTHKIISFTIRNFTIGGLVANKFEKSFANIARKLYSDEISTVDEINHLIAMEMVEDEQFMNSIEFAEIKTEKAAKYVLSELAYPEDTSKIELDDVRVIKINQNVENPDRLGNKLLITKKEHQSAKKNFESKKRVVANAKFKGTEKFASLLGKMTTEEINRRQDEWKRDATLVWSK
ncbi:DUF262 domain-containing protein [Lacticaseibacillus pabuli]|uniref:DUF262 domain-containing protein n=1 Tax=Lacticaseibacillus pabuli TaxID=3025672 RepID=A0ABY7WXC7_9LACO|nr:DUF262 domain-containing protein [Lacticaseibacillus sp. KACC 23028]WDF82585.1 DUF262 domain-containing protein [Lacticaseibacillus sp. KACC 23028]